MKTVLDEILDSLPGSSVNNSRKIMRDKVEFYTKHAERGNWAWKKLEDLGFTADYIDGDAGNEPINNFD